MSELSPWYDVAAVAVSQLRGLQHPRELAGLLEHVAVLQPAVVLEIGTRTGATLWAFSKAAPDAVLISIDPTNERRQLQQLVGEHRSLHLIPARSQEPWTLIAVERLLQGEPVGFLFVDDSHLEEDVRLDLQMYGPLVDPDGLVALHDIATVRPEVRCEVHRVWRELRRLPHTFEIFDADASPPMGIGVLPARVLSAAASARPGALARDGETAG